MIVRVVLVALAVFGIGVVAYALLWFPMPVAGRDPEQPATGGHSLTSKRQLAGLSLLSVVAVSVLGQLGASGGNAVVLPLVLAGAGIAVIWRQFDTDATLLRGASRWGLAGGVLLGAAGLVLLLATTGQLANARNGFTATVVILVGIAL